MVANNDPRIIWSADGVSAHMLSEIVDNEAVNSFPSQVAVKLDRLLLTQYGLEQISIIQAFGRPVFADAKIIEIPEKCLEIAKLHLKHKPWMLNIMAGACSTGVWDSDRPDDIDALKRFADLCHQAGTKPCAVTVLTSKRNTLAFKEFWRTAVEQVLFYAELLLQAGFTDIVCSAQEAKALRKESRFDSLDINTPGIRLPDDDANGQARTMTPHEAIQAGASRLVIGRPLSKNGAFANNYARIMADIEGV
ncbi:orotidine 5'-phosphate decarboxylase [Candidatus Saccharibacteria bacterium]|nr:orotidine 5'-phosphate decarboxylase [Candidatus Saccharibacteria bacterium]